MVKAQVHAGGRGKAGGVKLARDLDTVRSATADMLGQRLVTKQTGPEGLPIESVYVETGSDIEREIYLSLTLNRERGRIAVIASEAGGMDIEEVAEHTPEKILRVDISPDGRPARLISAASSPSDSASRARRSANSSRSSWRCIASISSATRRCSR